MGAIGSRKAEDMGGGLASLSRKTVLLIDDDADHLGMLEMVLSGFDYTFIKVSDATEALEFMVLHQVDLIISDVCLPGISGLQLSNYMQSAQPEGKSTNVPIILISSGDPLMLDDGLVESGADMFCLKSQMVDMLPAQVRFLIG